MDPELVSIQFSMSGGNDELIHKLEPGAPSVKRRLAALNVLSKSGFWTTVRLNPLFPIYPDGYYTDQTSIRERFGSIENVPKLELFDWTFLERLKENGVPSVLVGFVRLSHFAVAGMSKQLGIDFSSFFKPELFSRSSDSRFSDSEIAYYYMKIQAICAKIGLRFNTCYIGMGAKDYFQHQGLWDNRGDCCDARTNVKAFQATSQDVPWEVRLKHAPHKDDALSAQLEESLLNEAYKVSLALPISGLRTDISNSSSVEISQGS